MNTGQVEQESEPGGVRQVLGLSGARIAHPQPNVEPRTDKDTRPPRQECVDLSPLLHLYLGCAGPTLGGLVPLNPGLLGPAVNLESQRPHDLLVRGRNRGLETPTGAGAEPSQASGFSTILCCFYRGKLARYLLLPGLCEQDPQNV